MRDVNYYTYGNALKLLYSEKFFVKVPRIYIYTEKEKEMLGIGIDEVNGNINKKSMLELVDSYKSVYEIAEIVYEDRTVMIENESDILKILEIANEALNILEHAPNTNNEHYEELEYSLNALIEKIKLTHGDYLAKLYKQNDKVENYIEDTFGGFNKLINIKKPEVVNVNASNDHNKRIYGINFDTISI